MVDHGRKTWAIVLAAGEGSRLAPLTRQLYGFDLPKQFAVLAGPRSLLQDTVARMSAVAPPERTLVVVASKYRDLAHKQLAPWRGVHVLSQPQGRGTGPGILWPLARCLARDPQAQVVVTPSDHHVPEPRPFLAAIRAAVGRGADRATTLLGVRAERPETEYGWIVPGAKVRGQVHSVERFVEKPESRVARTLFEQHGLWNTFVLAGSARRMWDAAAERLPDTAAALEGHEAGPHADRADVLDSLYRDIGPADFSRDVLAHTPNLGVVAVDGSGWNDWGSSDRVFDSLAAGGQLEPLLARIRSRQHEAPPVGFAEPAAIAS